MKSGPTPKTIALFFLLLVALYLAVFYGMEYARHRKGPWEVNFMSDREGNPAIVIYQPRLNLSSVEILFPGEKIARTNLSERVAFDRPLKTVPFGKVIYEDLTQLPGVVTFDLFGHEIELLPRVLWVDKKEIPWRSENTIEVSLTNKPAHPPQPPKGRSK